MKYSQVVNHMLKECEFVQLDCPVGCGVSYPRSLNHMIVCPKTLLVCNQCDMVVDHEEKRAQSHDCVKYLKSQVNYFKDLYEEQRKENDFLKEQLERMEKIDGDLMDEFQR